MKITNMIGLECERFVVKPSDCHTQLDASKYTSSHDDLRLLAEVRGKPGACIGESLGNFVAAEWALFLELKDKKVWADPTSTEMHVDAATYRACAVFGKPKHSPNIYGHNIDDSEHKQYKDGKCVSYLVSAGLHVHFSSTGECFRSCEDCGDSILVDKWSRISMLQIKTIVRGMDAFCKKHGLIKGKSGYRKPGFYELKPYGFEYRSLPAMPYGSNMMAVVEEAFRLLKKATE